MNGILKRTKTAQYFPIRKKILNYKKKKANGAINWNKPSFPYSGCIFAYFKIQYIKLKTNKNKQKDTKAEGGLCNNLLPVNFKSKSA